MSEQEDEEEQLRWRVEAEVKLALDAAHAAAAERDAHHQQQMAALRVRTAWLAKGHLRSRRSQTWLRVLHLMSIHCRCATIALPAPAG